MSLEDAHTDGGHNKRKGQDASGDLVLFLGFTRSRVDSQHQEDDVEGRGDVKDLEEEVVPVELWGEGEESEVTSTEDETVERLGEERYTFGGVLAVDGIHQHQLRTQMADVGGIAKGIKQHDGWVF